MGIKFSNFIDTTIADVGGVSAVATEFTVNAGDGALFPALGVGDHCVIVCITAAGAREIMHVTDVTVDTLTVVRARESTTGLVFAQDDIVQGRVTAGSLALLDDLDGLTATPAQVDTVITATDAATVSTLMKRDAAGRAKVVAPDAAADIALKSTVTADIATHDALATAHGVSSASYNLTGNGDFTAGTVYAIKRGNWVTVSWTGLTHASDATPTAAVFLAAAFRPAVAKYVTIYAGAFGISQTINIAANGQLHVAHTTSVGGAEASTTVRDGSTVFYKA